MIFNGFSWIYWNPDRVFVTIPYLNHQIMWYGVWFLLGFVIGYFILLRMFQFNFEKIDSKGKQVAKQQAYFLVDRLVWFMVLGTLIGARLGHVFFYDWPLYKYHLSDIFKVWEGGLSSHGATVGILLALYFYRLSIRKDYPELTFLRLSDMLTVPTGVAAACIRMGNFFNQEILGIPSALPWAIIFGNPADGSPIMPRHPVQLYEALFYLFAFVVCGLLWKKGSIIKHPGKLTGLFFIIVFGSRFFIEFLKVPQSAIIDEQFWQTGHLLSIPFLVLGIYLFYRGTGKNS